MSTDWTDPYRAGPDLEQDQEAQEVLATAQASPLWDAIHRLLDARRARIYRMLSDPTNEPTLDAFLKGGLRALEDIQRLPTEARAWVETRERTAQRAEKALDDWPQ